MSINDKIKVLWKTSCEWRGKPHFPKRRDFQLREGESEGSLLPLNLGDAAKIKFGSRWYNVEVAESWSPKPRKGMCRKIGGISEQFHKFVFDCLSISFFFFRGWKKNSCQAESTAPSSTQAEVSDDPYATLQAEQRKREMQWKSQRVPKRSKAEEPAVLQTAAIPSETRPSEVICTVIENVADQSDQTDELKTQLEAKSQECSNLKRQLEISEKKREADAEALRKQTQVNGDIMKVSV